MHAKELLSAFCVSLSQAIDTDVKFLLNSLSLLVRLSPAELWIEAMHSSGLFSKLLGVLADDNVSSAAVQLSFAEVCMSRCQL